MIDKSKFERENKMVYKGTVALETKRLILRSFEKEDIPLNRNLLFNL